VALMGASLGPLSPPLAAANTSVVVTLPSTAEPELLGTSSNGQYFAYTDHPGGGKESAPELHWYNQQTGGDVVVAVVYGSEQGRISADGHHVVFAAWGADPLGKGLVQGNVYEATIDDAGNVSYTPISPNDGRQFMFPSVNAAGTIVSYMAWGNPGANYVWSSATGEPFQLPVTPGFSAAPAVLSSDGSTIAAVSGSTGLTEYSAVNGEALRTLNIAGVSNQVNISNLSADGSYGVGFSYGAPEQTGYAYFDFATGSMQVIPNSADNFCTGGNYSPIAVSDDGQGVVFGSLSNGLVPDPAGGSLGYFSYDPATALVTNQSGNYGGGPPYGDCPSAAITGDGQTMFFVSNYTPPVPLSVQLSYAGNNTANTAVPFTAGSHVYIYKEPVSHTVVPPVPVNTVPPTVSGTPLQGQALTEANGLWTNSPASFSYQWEDCNSAGNNCSPITGASSQTYALSASDVGHTIRVQESATNAGGAGGPVASVPTTVVTAPATGGGSTGTAGGGSTGTGGGGSTGAGGLTGGGSTLGTGAGGMLSNAFTLGGSQPGSNGSLLVTADVPGPGTLTAQQAAGARQASIAANRHKRKGRAQPKLIQPASVTARKAGAVTLTLKPTAAALKLLHGHRSVKVSVRITFTPTGGTPSNHTIQVTFKAPKGKHGH
jgi:hypothetical protein